MVEEHVVCTYLVDISGLAYLSGRHRWHHGKSHYLLTRVFDVTRSGRL